jgi:hypothetical protein
VVRRLCVLLLLLLPAAACGPGEERRTAAGISAERLVLQAEDLPGYRADLPEGGQTKWSAGYRRSAGGAEGPSTIESTAEILSSSESTREQLSEVRGALEERPGWQPIGEPGLGEESFASTSVHDAVRSYELVWRDGNVIASLSVRGSEAELAFADVLALAEKQERRISDATA